MFDLVSYVGSCDVIVESFRVVLDDDLSLAFAFVFTLYKFLVKAVVGKGLDECAKFLLLVVSG